MQSSKSYNRRPRALAHADRLATALDLDMAAAGWVPTVETYFGRVTKAQIQTAVREVKGGHAADLIASLKKANMAAKAEDLLAGSGWLPQPLRTPGRAVAPSSSSDHETIVAAAIFDDAIDTENEATVAQDQVSAAD